MRAAKLAGCKRLWQIYGLQTTRPGCDWLVPADSYAVGVDQQSFGAKISQMVMQIAMPTGVVGAFVYKYLFEGRRRSGCAFPAPIELSEAMFE